MLQLSELTRDVPCRLTGDVTITGLAIDSRKVQPGNLYVCLVGTQTDGHLYVPQAIANGAAAVLALMGRETLADSHPQTVFCFVPDTAKALADVASLFFGHPTRDICLVGVTGTNGKTTVTHLVERIWQAAGLQSGLLGTLGIRWGHHRENLGLTTPGALELLEIFRRMVDDRVSHAVMEVSSHALQQKRVASLRFDVAAFTNLTQDHLDYHGSMTAYRDAKTILFHELLKPKGVSVVNADDPHWHAFRTSNTLTYALDSEADIRGRLLQSGLRIRLMVDTPWGELPLNLKMAGRFNAYNALTALAIGRSSGISLEICQKALEEAPPVPGRLEVVAESPFTVLVDYAHTPDGLANVLHAARGITQGRLIVVYGCGGDRDKAKRPLMGRVAESLADLAVITSDNPRSEEPEAILAEIVAGLAQPQRAQVVVDRRQAIRDAFSQAQPGDTVVIAGKGHETGQIFRDHTVPFDDRHVARELLHGRLVP